MEEIEKIWLCQQEQRWEGREDGESNDKQNGSSKCRKEIN